MAPEIGKWLHYTGFVLMLLGMVLMFFPGAVAWFGKLPGDIRIQGERVSFFFPLTSMLVVSVILTVCVRLFERYISGK